MSIIVCLLRRPVVLLVSQVFLVFQETPEEMACLDHVVLLAGKENLERGDTITQILSNQTGNNVFGRETMTKIQA